jgi:nitrogen fixation protein FixH
MNTMITLFGGLGAVLVLYAIGGFFRGLPPMLRALLAGILPLVGYFILVMGRWPGIDVVAIHISVFLVAALVLFALTQFRRRGAERMHWVPKLLAGFFIGLVFINATLLYISTQGLPVPIGRWWLGSDGGPVYSGFSGVVSHGQNAAGAVSSELSEAHRESLLGWHVEVSGLDITGNTRPVQVRVKDRTGLPVDRVSVELRLQRPGAAVPALIMPLNPADAGVYAGSLTLPAAGRWLVELRLIQGGGVHYRSVQELVVP